LLLQDGGDKIFWASLRELAAWLLTLFFVEVVWVLAEIAILLLARRKQRDKQQGQNL